MICWRTDHALLEAQVREWQHKYQVEYARNEVLQQQLTDVRTLLNGTIGDRDVQIAKLEANIQDLHREAAAVSNDILVSMGIRQTPAGPEPMLPAAKASEDRQDDEIAGLSVGEWQDTAQRLEWEAYTTEQQQELQDYIERRKAELAQQSTAKRDAVNAARSAPNPSPAV